MDVAEFPLPPYGVAKLVRHGHSIERLFTELEQKSGEFGVGHSPASALAFDAADFVWAALMTKSPEAQHTREIRNAVAEAIMRVLRDWDGLPSEMRDDL